MTQEPPPATETKAADASAAAAFDPSAVSEAAARLSAARLLVPCCVFLAAVLTAGTDALGPEGLAAGILAGGGRVMYALTCAPASSASAKGAFLPRYASPLAGCVLCFFALTGAAGALPEGTPWSAVADLSWRHIIPVLSLGAMFALMTAAARPNADHEEPSR